MRPGHIQAASLTILALALCLCPGQARAQSADIKVETQLVWATNDSSSPDPAHKPVQPDLRKRLKELPFKWSNYFEVNRKDVELAANAKQKVELSEKCDLEVKNLGNSMIEVALYGKGEKVVKRTQTLPKGEILVLGGNAPNETAWLVVVKRVK
ncbi:MAG TPA: hypothetical protein VN673_12395 [Clostridia bacterium]|nr:hypothetical protein [Clostridia bacterium]